MSELLNLAEYKQQLTEQISNLDLSDYELPYDFKRQFHNFGEYKIEEYYKYTIKVSSKKSVCYIPNQWVFIAAICSKYCIELKKYKQKLQSLGVTDEDFESCHPSTSDKSIPEEHRKDEYVSKKAKDLLSSYSGDDKDLLISFLWDYDSWGGGKNIKRDNDFTISPCLNVANSINASSSLIGDLAKAIGDDMNLYSSLVNSAEMDKIRKGTRIVKNELVREKSAASFLKTAMKTTLDIDNNFLGLEKTGKYKVTKKNLKINGFWFGRDKDQPPTRESDIYPDVSWSYKSVDYVLNVEITPKDMEEIFFPVYNDAYQKQLYMEKDLNGEYVLYEIIKSQRQVNSFNTYPLQQIFYGAPGTGKSFKIKECTQGDDTVIRTTFHPDSDYSTFVGCYKPTMINKEPVCTVGELINKLSAIKNSGVTYPCDKFAERYWESLKNLSLIEINNILTACGFTMSMNVEIKKGIAVGEYFAKEQKNKKIAYAFVPQAFTKAYIQAWKKLCDTSLWAKKATAISPVGEASTPYKRTGKTGDVKVFERPKDSVTRLTDKEKMVLLEVDNFDFPFDGINNFGELHNQIKVIVTDEPNTEQKERYKKTITLTATQIRDLVRKYLDNRNIYGFLEFLLSKILKKLGWSWHPDLEKLKDYKGNDISIEVEESHLLLGLYDPETKMVYLFKNNIGNDINLLRATYIHEMFHAYFHSHGQYVSEIEEPIVECCALCFLELFDENICNTYLKDVESKKHSSAICYYGFGAYLFEHRSLDWMKMYQDGFNNIDASSSIVKDYTNKVFPIYPFDDELGTMNLLYNILNPQSNTEFDKSAQFLIIEEINRGNCAQIFGDLFQLLDRKEGYSEYPIEADDDLRKELEREFDKLNLDALKHEIDFIFKENYPHGITDKIKSGKLLVLPKNLFIWATMNTSDQSLFPIDSAFKRRWEWKYIPIKNHEDKGYTININGVKYDWWGFLARINQVIGETTSSEDKKLGYFFAKAKGKTIDAEQFVGKVLFYIWNDVFKNYGFDNQIFSKGDKKKFEFSDFFKNDGTANDDAVNMFLRKLEETIKIEDLPLEIKEEGVSEVPEK